MTWSIDGRAVASAISKDYKTIWRDQRYFISMRSYISCLVLQIRRDGDTDMAAPTFPIILGGGIIGDPSDPTARIRTPAMTQEYVNDFCKYGGTTIDTSRRYSTNAPGASELLLGTTDIATWATSNTKVLLNPGDHAPENIATSISKNLEALRIPSVHIIYCHYPDRTQPLESLCAPMAQAIHEGNMQHWGFSNYSINEVRQIIFICKGQDYPKPVVYQGHYNALAQKREEKPLPLLREYGIAFYAYSRAAGRALSKNSSRKAAVVANPPS